MTILENKDFLIFKIEQNPKEGIIEQEWMLLYKIFIMELKKYLVLGEGSFVRHAKELEMQLQL